MRLNIIEQVIELPQGIKLSQQALTLVIEGPKGRVERRLEPKLSLEIKPDSLRISMKKATKREKTTVGTLTAHIHNMIHGVTEGFTYRMKICSGHFPMTVQVKGNEFIVKNFIGEKTPRVMKLKSGVEAKVEGDIVVISSADKELAGQTAASIEALTTRANYDKRVFQDGIYITEKPERVLK